MAWPPVEAGLAADQIAIVGKGDAALGDYGVEFGEAFEVPADDGLVDMDPEGLGGLKFWAVGWQMNEADTLGHVERRGR